MVQYTDDVRRIENRLISADWDGICDNMQKVVNGRKFRRLCSILLLLGGSFAVIGTIAGLSYFDRQHNNILHHYVAREDDVAILSATYYARSKSFENNTVVILLSAHQVLHYKHSELTGLTTNSTHTVPATFRIYPVIDELPFYCKWVPFIAIGQVSEGVEKVELSTGGPRLQLHLRKPYTKPREVVACFSPLFLNERWQLLLLTAEVYSHYGAFMHFYVRSMISDLFKILKSYKHARIVPWGPVKLGEKRANPMEFDPNVELEFRNQAAAMTDCLLMYKESAQFILFPDTDDIIIPRLGKNYLEEFTLAFNKFPDAATIAYNMSQSSITTATSPTNYSVSSLLTSVHFLGETRWGKLVTKPERLDSTWIHKSYGVREGYEQVALPVDLNSILHMRFWNFTDETVNSTFQSTFYNPFCINQTDLSSLNLLIQENDLKSIHESFRNTTIRMAKHYDRLPRYSLYYPLIERCYDRIFYNGEHHNTCKGPELCDIPSFPGVRCTNVKSNYTTFTGYANLFIHYQSNVTYLHSHNGCTV